MTYAVHDFEAINRRLNRKPDRDPVSLADVSTADAMATLRAEVEQMERDQDILGLRLLADEAAKKGK